MSAFRGTPYPLRPLVEVCLRKEKAEPHKQPDVAFRYIDLSSVDNARNAINGAQSLVGSEAPSRARKRVRAGDTLFATTRPYLRGVVQVPDEFDDEVCSTGFCVLRPDPEAIEPDWLFFAALSDGLMEQVTPKMRGATYPAVSDKDVLGVEIPLPPVEEQRRLVGRIRACLDRVDAVRRLRAESVAAADQVEAAVFDDFLADAGLTDDDAVLLGSVLLDTQYGTSQKASPDGSGVPVLRMGNIQRGQLDTSDLKYVDLPEVEVAKYRLDEGDILFNRTNSLEQVGKSAVFTGLGGEWVAASYLIRLVVDPRKADARFVNAYINSRRGRRYVEGTANRAIGMVNVNAKKAAALPILLPSLPEQRRIADRVGHAVTLANDLRRQQAAQAEQENALTQAVLARAFAGEL